LADAFGSGAAYRAATERSVYSPGLDRSLQSRL
jgi:hypothetical protein